MKRTLLGLVPALALVTFTVGCGDDGSSDTVADETAGDGDGDPTTTGDGDGDPTTTGDGDGDPTTTGDGDGDPTTTGGTDSDMDGVDDSSDNCPDDPNPNQLDFDDNGMGNVCDVQVFTTVTGTLNSTANASGAVTCSIQLMIQVTAGEIRVQLDDDAAVAAFEVTHLAVADIPDKTCSFASVSLSNFNIDNSGDPFPVSMPHSQTAHDAGSIAGNSDGPHPVLATADLEASIGGQAQPPSQLNLDGAVPVFTANITGAGAQGTLSWADGQFVVATDTFDVMGLMIDFELKGLVGTLTLAP